LISCGHRIQSYGYKKDTDGHGFGATGVYTHVRGHNSHSIGIAYEGGLNILGFPSDIRTENYRISLQSLVASFKRDYTGVEVVGHRDLSPDFGWRQGDFRGRIPKIQLLLRRKKPISRPSAASFSEIFRHVKDDG
jgi:N-acetyl-anhydromuramyl-L-alanine amidase AmpD